MEGFINKQYTVWCGNCEEWHQESFENKANFIKAVKRLGWKTDKDFMWLCLNCVEKKNEGKFYRK